MKIVVIPQLTDNYAYLVRANGRPCAVVDPADASSILRRCRDLGATLSQIWVTHHHADHTAGIVELLRQVPEARIFMHPVDWQAFAKRQGDVATIAAGRVVLVEHGHRFELVEMTVEVIFNPGHTMGAISYYVDGDRDIGNAGPGAVFTGDTLFGAGCGRRFEAPADTFYESLMRLAALPGDTSVYFGHEYTSNNLKFALTVEPANIETQARATSVLATRGRGEYTTPSTVALERATNPFLRCGEPAIITAVQAQCSISSAQPADIFAALRAWKDNV